MLRVAIPNKGALSTPAVAMLKEAGYKVERSGRELCVLDANNEVEFFFLRPRDIAVYVGQGTIAAGITGSDLLVDSGQNAIEHLQLNFARSTFHFAGPKGKYSTVTDIAGKRIATSYDVIVENFLKKSGLEAQIVHLDGAVESSVQLGVADLIADVVETGSTLKAAGLEVFGSPIMTSQAVLITTQKHVTDPRLSTLEQRLQGVLVARSYVLVDYNAPTKELDKLLQVTPGVESPTIAPLYDREWMAVRAMVKREEINPIMDKLYQLGARGIIITDIMACRL